MAKKLKPSTKKAGKRVNRKANKKGDSIFQKIAVVIAAVILIPTVALVGLILYAGATGNTIEAPAPLMSFFERFSVSDNSISDNEVSGNSATTEGNVLNVAGVSGNGSGSGNGKTQKINLIYNNDSEQVASIKEPEKESEEKQDEHEQTISENITERKVWVTEEGLKYHTKANCGDVDSTDANEVTFLYALDEGYQPCETCYPDGNTEAEDAAYSDR